MNTLYLIKGLLCYSLIAPVGGELAGQGAVHTFYRVGELAVMVLLIPAQHNRLISSARPTAGFFRSPFFLIQKIV